MNPWKSIKRLSFEQLFRLTLVLLRKPLMIAPTWNATRQTMQICDSLYKGAHHKNGKANAFRHALWNILICQKVLKKTKNGEKSVFWAKKMTDLHEKMAKSEKINAAMDLHNNKIGRLLFLELLGQNEVEMTGFLQKKFKTAQKVSKIEEINMIKNELVYVSE